MQEMLLRRRHKVVVPEGDKVKRGSILYVAAMQKEFERLGFAMEPELLAALSKTSVDYIEKFYKNTLPVLKHMVGDDVKYTPMYPNFPDEVRNSPELELYFRAIIHYVGLDSSLFADLPHEEVEDRLPLINNSQLKIIGLGTQKDVNDMACDLFAMPVSYSLQDKQDIQTIFRKMGDLSVVMPETFPNKENLVQLTLTATEYKKDGYFMPYYRTATDVMRLYAGLSDGDISLSSHTHFCNLNRTKCKQLLSLLDKTKDLEECMKKDPQTWKAIMRHLRVGDYPYFKTVTKAYDKLYNNRLPQTFMGRVNDLVLKKEITAAAYLLAKRPGEFARNLDTLLRDCATKAQGDQILHAFSTVASQVSVPVLLQLRSHLSNRDNVQRYRVAFPKGNVARAYMYEESRVPLPEDTVKGAVKICSEALQEKFQNKGKMGSVYVDPKLAKIKAPLVLRNASKAAKTVPRGSRFGINEKTKTARAFVWWGNDIDNDLSAVFFDKKWTYMDHVSYTNLKNDIGTHSGDFTHWRSTSDKKNGLCEFVDIDLKKAEQLGVGYVVFEVHNFTGESFDRSPCRFGYMERDGKTGQLFEPKTVENVCDLTTKSTSVMPMVYDVEHHEFIWCDIAINPSQLRPFRNVENTLTPAMAAAYACVNNESPDLYSVIMDNVISRDGIMVEEPQKADYVFTLDGGFHAEDGQVVVSPFETEKVLTSVIGTDPDPYATKEEKTIDEKLDKLGTADIESTDQPDDFLYFDDIR